MGALKEFKAENIRLAGSFTVSHSEPCLVSFLIQPRNEAAQSYVDPSASFKTITQRNVHPDLVKTGFFVVVIIALFTYLFLHSNNISPLSFPPSPSAYSTLSTETPV